MRISRNEYEYSPLTYVRGDDTRSASKPESDVHSVTLKDRHPFYQWIALSEISLDGYFLL